MLKHRGQSGKFDVTKQCSQLQKALQTAVERSKSNYALDEPATSEQNLNLQNYNLRKSHSHVLNTGLKFTPKRGFTNPAFINSTHTISENENVCYDDCIRC